MARSIYQALSIEKEEQSPVVLLLMQSFFLGIFYGTFEIGALTLFLGVFEPGMISNAILVSGIVGILMTLLYSKLQASISFSKLAILNLMGILLITAALRFGLDATPAKWLIFFVFVMMGPLNIVALLGFWGVVGRMFTLRQGKRLFGLIDTGQVVGIIISTYAVPLLLNFNFEIKNLLLISAISIVAALVFQYVIKYKFNIDKQEGASEEVADTGFKVLIKDRYILLMMLFVSLSMIAAFFIYTSFLAVTDEKYPNPNDLANFLSVFTGTLMVFTILIKTFVYSNLLKTYGLKTSLLLAPVLIGLFTIIASLVGSFGYTIDMKAFVFFFLIMSLSRLFSVSLKMSIEAPSLKLLYQSLSAKIRFDVQAKIDGTVNEMSVILSGFLLTGMSLLSFFQIIHYSYFLVVVVIAWLFIAFKLYNEYRRSLERSLTTAKETSKDQQEGLVEEGFTIPDLSKEESPLIIINILNIVKAIEPAEFEKEIIKLINHDSSEVRKYVIEEIDENKISLAINSLKEQAKVENEEDLKKITLEVIKSIETSLNKNFSETKIKDLSKSRESVDRKLAARIIGEDNNEKYRAILIALLKDVENDVRIESIKSASKLKHIEYCPLLADNLQIAELIPYSSEALINIGTASLTSLEQLFHKTGVDNRIMVEIVRIYGEIGDNEAINLLLKKLSYHRRDVVFQVVESLHKCDYQADEDVSYQVQQSLTDKISVLAWNMAAIISIKEEKSSFSYLKEAIEEEIISNYNTIFLLLSLAYDPESIKHVRENLESGTTEGVGFAIELLDLFVSEELKPVLFPILEDTSYADKIKQLQNHFPIEKMDTEDLLNAVVNRDINKISAWVKACALYHLSYLKDFEISDGFIAHLFNKDELLRETSAYVINKISPKDFESSMKRVDKKVRKELETQINLGTEDKSNLLIEKILFLKTMEPFKKLSSEFLVSLAKRIEDVKLNKDEIFELQQGKRKLPFLISVKGRVGLMIGEKHSFEMSNSKILDIGLIDVLYKKDIQVKALESTLIYKVEREYLNDLMFKNKHFANVLIEHTYDI